MMEEAGKSVAELNPADTPNGFLIAEVCDEIKNLLLTKNRKYGNSALSPVRIFSKTSDLEQFNVRIDDKLSRIANAQSDEDEDPELDLIGYLILKRVKMRQDVDPRRPE